eukprot:15348788-Ditylum_brightwellii.AAC.1
MPVVDNGNPPCPRRPPGRASVGRPGRARGRPTEAAACSALSPLLTCGPRSHPTRDVRGGGPLLTPCTSTRPWPPGL